ncbi:hypothetical protein SAMN05421505_13822 [Sinosporangium album]|uniref:Uncharacterized protein n=1 Tax=Sinosporangium album TaxID=504805 RepID=A0A1G8IN57_9ACTN|nr:hypothetical protein [Sinosporangium album]SDI20478.1 hypothetical protein SAMN05421505_13822 [Sinosporangium album]
MTTSRTNQATEWSCYIPMWDEATEEFHNAWITYRTDDPYFVLLEIEDWPAPVAVPRVVLLEIEDWPAPVAVPRVVLLDGLSGRAECLSKPDRTALRVEPSSDSRYLLLGVTQGNLSLAVFRAPADVLARHMAGMHELVPEGEEMAHIDWDAVIANLMLA